MSTKSKKRGKLHRVNAQDAATLREMLISALTETREQTQRQFISQHLPDLYVLRNLDGWSFKQISNLLRMRGIIKLSEPSLRVYYSQLLAGRESECLAKMKEVEPLIATIKNEASGLDVSHIAAKVTEILNRGKS